jgi:hypothetical protein
MIARVGCENRHPSHEALQMTEKNLGRNGTPIAEDSIVARAYFSNLPRIALFGQIQRQGYRDSFVAPSVTVAEAVLSLIWTSETTMLLAQSSR